MHDRRRKIGPMSSVHRLSFSSIELKDLSRLPPGMLHLVKGEATLPKEAP